MIDIVISDGNEKEFLKMAEDLGYDELVFLYEKQPKNNAKGKKAFFAENQNQAGKNKGKYDYILAEPSKWAFHDKRVDAIFNLEGSKRKDFVHHRASEMNQVLAKQAADTGKKIAFNFSSLYDEKKRDMVLGRMKQNVKICRKYKIGMVIASFAIDPYEMRAPKDLQAFGETIGMHPSKAKKALRWS